MTLPGRPCSIAISKASRSASRAAAASIRASSTTRSVSCAFRAKCLTVAMTWRLCTPAIAFPAMSPVSSGSSEKILEIAAAARIADQIGRASEQDRKAFAARFGADGFALSTSQIRIPARSQREIRGHRGGCVPGSDEAGIWRRRVRRRFPAGVECRAEERRARSLPNRSPPGASVFRPRARRDRRGPERALPHGSFARPPSGRVSPLTASDRPKAAHPRWPPARRGRTARRPNSKLAGKSGGGDDPVVHLRRAGPAAPRLKSRAPAAPTNSGRRNRRALRRSTPYRPRKLLLRLGAIGSQALPAVLNLVLQQRQAERKRTNGGRAAISW